MLSTFSSKYLSTILITLITAIISIIATLIVTYLKTSSINYEDLISTMLGALLSLSLMQSIMYPIIYKYGIEKARLGIFVLVFAIFIIGALLYKLCDFSSLITYLDSLGNYIIIIIPILIILMLYISYKVSEHINFKKEY